MVGAIHEKLGLCDTPSPQLASSAQGKATRRVDLNQITQSPERRSASQAVASFSLQVLLLARVSFPKLTLLGSIRDAISVSFLSLVCVCALSLSRTLSLSPFLRLLFICLACSLDLTSANSLQKPKFCACPIIFIQSNLMYVCIVHLQILQTCIASLSYVYFVLGRVHNRQQTRRVQCQGMAEVNLWNSEPKFV